MATQQFRLATIHIPVGNKNAAKQAIRAGLQIVKAALKKQPDDPEFLVLGAMLAGQKTLISHWSLLTLDVISLRRLKKAQKLAPLNPGFYWLLAAYKLSHLG